MLPAPAAVQRVLAGPMGGTATPDTFRSIACPSTFCCSGARSPGSELTLKSVALEKADLLPASHLSYLPLTVARLSGTRFGSSLVYNTTSIFS